MSIPEHLTRVDVRWNEVAAGTGPDTVADPDPQPAHRAHLTTRPEQPARPKYRRRRGLASPAATPLPKDILDSPFRGWRPAWMRALGLAR